MPRKTNRKGEILRAVGERMRAYRLKRGLTQEELAEKLHLSVAYVSLLERGGRNPPTTTLVDIANALGAAPAALLG